MPVNPDTGARYAPRHWQQRALPALRSALTRKARSIVVACTGAGKSVLISEVCALTEAVAEPNEVVVVACPTQDLVRQLSKSIALRAGKEKVGRFYGQSKQANRRIVVVCYPSLQTLVDTLRLLKRRVRLAIVDECHKSEADTFKSAFAELAPRFQLGFTATPFRSADDERLSLWDEVCFRYVLPEAFSDGVLVRPTPVWWDGNDSDDLLDICVRMIEQHGHGPGVVSAVSIVDAEECATELTARGIEARAIHSAMGTKAREEVIADLRAGRIRCLVHVAMLVEGVDFPWLSWLCLRAPIGSKVKLAQQIGRVIRSHPGKSSAIVMDPHGLMQQWNLVEPEAIGAALEEALEEDIARAKPDPDREVERQIIRPATAISDAMQWTRRLLMELQASGMAAFERVDPGTWRTATPSAKQLQSIAKMKYWARFLPDGYRESVTAMCRPEIAAAMQRGAVSDMLSLLAAIAARAQQELGSDWRERAGGRIEWPQIDVEPLDTGSIKTVKKWRTE